MGCTYSRWLPDEGRWSCTVSGDGCVFMRPNSKACAELYGEGPDAVTPGEVIIEEETNDE